jgi:hypothetical protein
MMDGRGEPQEPSALSNMSSFLLQFLQLRFEGWALFVNDGRSMR